jgi:hypothetical protein
MKPGFFSNADAMKQTDSAKWQQTLSLNNRVTRMWLNRSRHFSIIFKATPASTFTRLRRSRTIRHDKLQVGRPQSNRDGSAGA